MGGLLICLHTFIRMQCFIGSKINKTNFDLLESGLWQLGGGGMWTCVPSSKNSFSISAMLLLLVLISGRNIVIAVIATPGMADLNKKPYPWNRCVKPTFDLLKSRQRNWKYDLFLDMQLTIAETGRNSLMLYVRWSKATEVVANMR